MRKTFLAVIPTKSNSSRLPNKNILDIGGLPLFLHSVNYAKESNIEYIVLTDNGNVSDECKKYGCEFWIEDEIDDRKIENSIIKYLNTLDKMPDVIIILQPTSPIRFSCSLKEYISKFLESGKRSLITVNKMRPLLFKDGRATYDTYNKKITQDTKDEDYHRYFNGSVSIVDVEFLLKHKTAYDETPYLAEQERLEGYQIDYEEEYIMIKHIYENIIDRK